MTTKKRVLIVDDERGLREVFRLLLEENYLVTEASDGREGLETALSSKPDLIISDVVMPHLDGLEMLAKVKEAGLTCPVIIVSAFTDVSKIREAWKLGAFDFVDKPVNEKTFLETIHRALTFGDSFRKTAA